MMRQEQQGGEGERLQQLERLSCMQAQVWQRLGGEESGKLGILKCNGQVAPVFHLDSVNRDQVVRDQVFAMNTGSQV